MEKVTKNVEEAFAAAEKMVDPAEVKKVAQKSVDAGRKQFEAATSHADKAMKDYAEAVRVTGAEVDQFGRKMFDHAVANATAMFDGASKILKCKDVAEVADVQRDLVKKQIASMNDQAQELFEMNKAASERAIKNSVDLTRRAFDQFKSFA